MVKLSRGSNQALAKEYAGHVNFQPMQNDSVLTLPGGFVVTSDQKFHNQQVMVVISVPVGKQIRLDESVDVYSWFSIKASHNRRKNWAIQWDVDWDNDFEWHTNVDYVMTAEKGLKSLRSLSRKGIEEEEEQKENKEQKKNEIKKKIQELQEEQRKLQRSVLDDSIRALQQQSKINTPSQQQALPAAPKKLASGTHSLMPNPSGLLLMRFTR